MVSQKNARCDEKRWYREKRCSSFKSCDECDFLNLPYKEDAVLKRIAEERLVLQDLIDQKRDAKKGKNKVLVDQIDDTMRDKIVGVMVMQESEVIGGSFKSALQIMKMRKEIKRWRSKIDR